MAVQLRRVVRVLAAVIGAVVLLIAGFVVYVQLSWNRQIERPVVAMTAPRDAERIARGKHLYERSLLCWECHGSRGGLSPDEPQAGGREFDLTRIGPGFGYVYGSNVTPDAETGIGAWSDAELVRALREGIRRDGQLIFPVMAYQFYHGLSDEDALALVAYLRSLAPVRHEVPAKRPSFAAKALQAISFIKPESAITARLAAPPAAPTAEYGKYLAWHASGCAECHTPRDPKTARVDMSRPLAGGLFPFPEEGFETTGSNLTPDNGTGIGRWTEEQFMTAMQTGVRPDGRVMLPFMPWPSYSQWSRDDLHAVWLYLRSLTPVAHRVPASTLKLVASNLNAAQRGEAMFAVYCRTCHGDKGAGTPFTATPLREAAKEMDAEAIGRFISEGVPGTSMPGFAKTLTANQVADVVAFVRGW